MNRYLIFIAFLMVCSIAKGQQTATEKAIYQLFDNPGDIKWLKHFSGRIDDLNDIALSLAFDGKACKGFLVYLRSRERFRMEGSINDNNLRLREIDQSNATSGYLHGEIKGTDILGVWNNYNYTVSGNIHLQQIPYEARLPSFCGDNRWIQQFEGAIGGEAISLILQKKENNLLYGTAYLQNGKSWQVRGQLDENLYIDLSLKGASEEKVYGNLIGSYVNGSEINALFYKVNGEKSEVVFHMKRSLDIGCIEYADYIFNYDITYPKSKNVAFNQWIDKIAMDWVIKCREEAEKMKNSDKIPMQRASRRAYAWTEILFMSDEILSGFITFGNTWTSAHQTRAINFDLVNGKEITVDDIFKKKSKYYKFVRKVIKKEMKNSPNYEFPDFRQWIAKEEFVHFTIMPNGINFSTSYNSVFGQQHVLIPYDKIEPYLGKNIDILKYKDSVGI